MDLRAAEPAPTVLSIDGSSTPLMRAREAREKPPRSYVSVWCQAMCPVCYQCYEFGCDSLWLLCCPRERLGFLRGDWFVDGARNELELQHRVSGGACMWFCTASSVFFTLCALSLYIWDRQECTEYTLAGLVDGCADASSAAGGDFLPDAVAPGIVRSSAVRCVDDYDCELTGICNLTSAVCMYEDEKINRGSFLGLGLLCAILAAMCGGYPHWGGGGCIHAHVRIDPLPDSEHGVWTLTTEQEAWRCWTLERRPEVVLPQNTRARHRADVDGWTCELQAERPLRHSSRAAPTAAVPELAEDARLELDPQLERHKLWFGKPLTRQEATAMSTRVNQFLHPAEAAAAAAAAADEAQQQKQKRKAADLRGDSPSRPLRAVSPSPRGRLPRSPQRAPGGRTRPKPPPPPPPPGDRASTRDQDLVASTLQRRASATEAQRERELLSLQISETQLELKRAREQQYAATGAAAAAAAAAAGQGERSGGGVLATSDDLKDLLAELTAARRRLRDEFNAMSLDLQPKAAAAIQTVERDIVQATRQLEAAEYAEDAAHQLELLVSKQQLMQLLDDPGARDDAKRAITAIDQELWPPGSKPQQTRRPRSPIVARARSPRQ
jgi:hypothetical protein